MVLNKRKLRMAYLRLRLGFSDWIVTRIGHAVGWLTNIANHLDLAAEPRELEVFRMQREEAWPPTTIASSSGTKTAPPVDRETT